MLNLYINYLYLNINNYQNTVYNPDFELSNNKKRLKLNTCFNIDIFDDLNINIPNIKDTLFHENEIKEMTISEKIILNLNNKQKHILKIWFNV